MSDKQAEVKGHEWIPRKSNPGYGRCSCGRCGRFKKPVKREQWEQHVAQAAALASQVPAQPPASNLETLLRKYEQGSVYAEVTIAIRKALRADATTQEKCELCREGIPIKKYFDGSMRHFDGFMAWTKCESAYVRTQSRAFVSGFKAAIELAAQQAHCGDECTSSNILRLGIAEAIRAISIPPIADDAAPVPAQGTPPAHDVCIGCKRQLSERDFEHYENHPEQERLCVACFKESRAR